LLGFGSARGKKSADFTELVKKAFEDFVIGHRKFPDNNLPLAEGRLALLKEVFVLENIHDFFFEV
jgi:hypothetical protein